MNFGENFEAASAPNQVNGHRLEEASPATNSAAGNAMDNRVDKIRELIFGQQMVDYEARFKQLEARLLAEAAALRQAVENGLAELRAAMQKRSDEVQHASVDRNELAESLDKLASLLRRNS